VEFILLCFGVLFVLGCGAQLVVINANLKEVIVLLCRIINYQEAANPLPPPMPQYIKEP
jgi:hypothetical protein